MLQPLRSNPQRQRKAQGKSIPPPVEGWDAVSPLANMSPKRAIALENWFPQPGFVEVRKGYASHSTGMGSSTPVQSILIYNALNTTCLLYTSDAADERSSVDLGGRRI